MHPIGDYVIKHGEQLLIYNIFGKTFGNKHTSKKSKVNTTEEDISPTSKFEFKSIDIRLDVTDTKNLMTHHTWVWNFKNISKEPLGNLFYEIGGEVPKKMRDLNLTVKDKKGNNLEISSVERNKPLEKKFYIKLAKPIKQNQYETVIFEYDWEEPDKIFVYDFSAKCKKFKYVFTIPQDFEIKTRILENKGLGIKKHANPPPKINYKGGKTEIIWEPSKKHVMNVHDCYEFYW